MPLAVPPCSHRCVACKKTAAAGHMRSMHSRGSPVVVLVTGKGKDKLS